MPGKSGPDIYRKRQISFSSRLKREGIFASVISDFENSRNSSLRYLSGHPMDALLVVFADSETVLIPWDVNLAGQFASVSEIKPFTDFNRNSLLAVGSTASGKLKTASGQLLLRELSPDREEVFVDINRKDSPAHEETVLETSVRPVIEFPSSSPYPFILQAEKELENFSVLCSYNGSENFLESERIIKSEEETAFLEKAASITDSVFLRLEQYLSAGEELTETDIALFIETEGRKAGAEGTGFETLAASPERSFSIHPFPSYSDRKAPADGLTIIDFGHKYAGYTSDVTTTVAYGKLTERQEKMISLVLEATEIFENILAPGISTVALTEAVTSLFEKNSFRMPHALGHGIGLDVHESPVLKTLKETETILRPGMALAIEPGIYCPESGGVRLENDYLITETGFKKLTNSRIIRL